MPSLYLRVSTMSCCILSASLDTSTSIGFLNFNSSFESNSISGFSISFFSSVSSIKSTVAAVFSVISAEVEAPVVEFG